MALLRSLAIAPDSNRSCPGKVAGLPYCVARILPNSIEVLPAWHPELERFFEANYLLVHDRAICWFDARMGVFDVSNTYG
jgi:hypothetical protein